MFKIKLLPLFLLLGLWTSEAQITRGQLAANPERSAGTYRCYEYLPGCDVAAPKGYNPFYISHYGRHGCRWHASAPSYTDPLGVLRKASEAGVLTPRGVKLLAQVEVIAADAEGRYGDLSPRGVGEHRGIAERMFAAYPEVFSTAKGRECRIESRSTLVPRCILSMAAFNERLKELNPEIQTLRESSARHLGYLSYTPGMDRQRKVATAVADSLRQVRLHPERFLSSIFSDPQFVTSTVDDPQWLMVRFFLLAGIMQDVSYLDISLYDLFTAEELDTLWECENVRRYLTLGPSQRFGDPIIADAKPLLRNIVETAQRVVDGKEAVAATLRFGHDINITPLLALLGVEGASARVTSLDEVRSVWVIEQVSPMATNLQLIFFRNAAGDVRVRVLHNERDALLPLSGGPYYPWETLRAYCRTLYE